jgi:hypothetical protein
MGTKMAGCRVANMETKLEGVEEMDLTWHNMAFVGVANTLVRPGLVWVFVCMVWFVF